MVSSRWIETKITDLIRRVIASFRLRLFALSQVRWLGDPRIMQRPRRREWMSILWLAMRLRPIFRYPWMCQDTIFMCTYPVQGTNPCQTAAKHILERTWAETKKVQSGQQLHVVGWLSIRRIEQRWHSGPRLWCSQCCPKKIGLSQGSYALSAVSRNRDWCRPAQSLDSLMLIWTEWHNRYVSPGWKGVCIISLE